MWMGDYERLYGKKNEPEKKDSFSAKKVIIVILVVVVVVAVGRGFIESTAEKQSYQNKIGQYQPIEPYRQVFTDSLDRQTYSTYSDSVVTPTIPNEQSKLINNSSMKCLQCSGTGKIQTKDIHVVGSIKIKMPESICTLCGGSGRVSLPSSLERTAVAPRRESILSKIPRDSIIRFKQMKSSQQAMDSAKIKQSEPIWSPAIMEGTTRW